ncbi:endothelin-1 [Astyanax mexicanus]|uniref:Endothelin-1 n=1 Tax=Astyanax mexicanus TaxID=7994 RepID=A0A8T2ME07_ASTMX|nr:endothelin-1 [Astyanax mexicanus]
MELRIIFPVLSVLSSSILHTGAVPVYPGGSGETPSSPRHSRTKRCSCSTFLDKECVYFCHLDIIWVNTPERTVSYGLGNAPRRKRSAPRATDTQPQRCRCAETSDATCTRFCHIDYPPRRKAAPDKVIPTARGRDCAEEERKHDLAAQTRTRRSAVQSAAATQRILLLLEKWRLRRLHTAPASWRQK